MNLSLGLETDLTAAVSKLVRKRTSNNFGKKNFWQREKMKRSCRHFENVTCDKRYTVFGRER